MALNVQNDDGTVSGANGYESVAEFKSYHDDRGNDYSAFTDPQIAAAIIRATDYLDTRFSFRGVKQTNGVKATGTFTTTANFNSGETVTINGVTYKMVGALVSAFDVLIAGSTDVSLANLAKAINGSATPGVNYGLATDPNRDVTATSGATTLTVSAIVGGPIGNDITTSETCANASWGASSLSGGAQQTTEWPRMAGVADTFVSIFDTSWPPNILLDGTETGLIFLVGPDNVRIKGTPSAVKRACAEYALRALSIPLFQDMPAPEGGRMIDEHTVKVDTIEETIKYAPSQSGAFALPAFPAADMLLVRAGLIEQSRVLTR